MPFPLLGLDADADTVFMNETAKTCCEAAGIAFTRCRPYRKNDQALAELYRDMRPFVFFQPSSKLAGKEREGARVRKRHHDPRTPHQRLLADPRVPAEARDRAPGLRAQLDPAGLLNRSRQIQQGLSGIARPH